MTLRTKVVDLEEGFQDRCPARIFAKRKWFVSLLRLVCVIELSPVKNVVIELKLFQKLVL